jgi:hypothetical protein
MHIVVVGQEIPVRFVYRSLGIDGTGAVKVQRPVRQCAAKGCEFPDASVRLPTARQVSVLGQARPVSVLELAPRGCGTVICRHRLPFVQV